MVEKERRNLFPPQNIRTEPPSPPSRSVWRLSPLQLVAISKSLPIPSHSGCYWVTLGKAYGDQPEPVPKGISLKEDCIFML